MKNTREQKEIFFAFLKTAFLLIIIMCTCTVPVFSQTQYIKNRVNVKLGGTFNSFPHFGGSPSFRFRSEINFGIQKHIEVGTSFGLFKHFQFHYNPNDTVIIFVPQKRVTPYFGINANFHLLPFAVKEKDFRFDLYVASKIGINKYCSIKTIYPHGSTWQVFLGGGVAFYFFKHLGFYAEYGYDKHLIKYSNNYMVLRYGLTYKFKTQKRII